jgi:hypothetical protein
MVFTSNISAQQANNDTLKTKQQLEVMDTIIVAYYGRPEVASLGVLGQYSLKELIPIIKAKVMEYDSITENTKIIPAFDIIYGLAAGDPGRDKSYILPLSSSKLMPYINIARDSSFAVFIDLQLGDLSPLEAVQPVLKYLKYHNVHIAIDPEFEVLGLDEAPGKVVGHITGEDINAVQIAMIDYMNQNKINETKILIVHMFKGSMVQNKDAVKDYDKIHLIMNLDGHGNPKLKIDSYNDLYTERVATKVSGGFKLFFNEDKPVMMTPKQILGIESVDDVKIKESPKYINYQ